jgi:hypothetical protein
MDVSTPQAKTSLVPKRKLNSVNMTKGLWSEVSINKIQTRSITVTKAQVIIDNNFPSYNWTCNKQRES